MKAAIEAAELRSLGSRVVALERERAEAVDRAQLLSLLQEACARIAVMKTPDGVAHAMLRAARDPLGFERGVFFGTDRERGIAGRWQYDRTDTIEPCTDVPDLRAGGTILRALRGDSPQIVGRAGELSAPLIDTRGWYVVTALTGSDGTLGILYVDDHHNRTPREWETHLVRSLATLAAVSMSNSILFERTHALATRDSLTGLLNRRAFAEATAERLAACAGRRMLTYVMIDVDDFKAINDAHGHAHGDRVLQSVAATLLRASRARDLAGRFAGDEFVMLLEHDDLEPQSLMARISAELQAAGLRCSIGAARHPSDGADADALSRAADRALYAAKAAGKNRFRFA